MSLRSLLIALTFGVGACSRESACIESECEGYELQGEGSFEPFQKDVKDYIPISCFDDLVRSGTMSEKEQVAIYYYTKGIHGLNDRMRKAGATCPFCRLLQGALTKLPPIKESLTAYRGETWAFVKGSIQQGSHVEWPFLRAPPLPKA